MWIYEYDLDSDELEHHGIKGQKWGVRRYQNYDGSYTKKGLERYNQANSEYESAKSAAKQAKVDYKSGKGTKDAYKTAKAEVKTTKRKADKAYEQLKYDKRADQGKELYKRGKTITANTRTTELAQVGILAGATVAQKYLESRGNTQTSYIAAATIAAGGTAVNAILALKTNSENKKLRAYYTH